VDVVDGPLGQVEVGDRAADASMAKESLDGAEIDALLQQVGGVGVPQRVAGDGLGELGIVGGAADGLEHGLPANGLGCGMIGEEPMIGTVLAPVGPQELERSLGQGDVAVLASLAVSDADDHALAVDVFGAKMDGLRDAQAAGVHEDRAHAGGGPADVGQELTDLPAREDDGEFPVSLGTDEVEDGQRAPEGVPKEELDGEEVDAYGALGQAAGLGEMDEELSDLVFGELVGGSVEVACEVPDGFDVGSLGAFGQAAQAHVLNHTASQFGHDGLLLLLWQADDSPCGSLSEGG